MQKVLPSVGPHHGAVGFEEDAQSIRILLLGFAAQRLQLNQLVLQAEQHTLVVAAPARRAAAVAGRVHAAVAGPANKTHNTEG